DPGERSDRIAAESTRAARLREELGRFPGAGPPDATRPDTDAAQGLAALGYIGGVRDRGSSPLPNPRDNIRYLRRMRDGWRLAAERQYGQAVAALTAILKDNPDMVEVWIKLGEVYSEAGRDAEAEGAYTEALRRSPVFLDDVAIALGFAQLRRGRLEEAES